MSHLNQRQSFQQQAMYFDTSWNGLDLSCEQSMKWTFAELFNPKCYTRMFHNHHRRFVYHLYRIKTKSSVSLRNDIVSFWFGGYTRHMRTELQAHVQSQTRMEETKNTDGLATFIRNKV